MKKAWFLIITLVRLVLGSVEKTDKDEWYDRKRDRDRDRDRENRTKEEQKNNKED